MDWYGARELIATRLIQGPLRGHEYVLNQRYQHILRRFPAAGVTGDDRPVGTEIKGHADVFRVAPWSPVEAVQPDDEGDLAAFKIVDRRKAIGK